MMRPCLLILALCSALALTFTMQTACGTGSINKDCTKKTQDADCFDGWGCDTIASSSVCRRRCDSSTLCPANHECDSNNFCQLASGDDDTGGDSSTE